jgi:hypothetical protein
MSLLPFLDLHRATSAQALLARQGIKAEVYPSSGFTSFSHVQVPDAEEERARNIVAAAGLVTLLEEMACP